MSDHLLLDAIVARLADQPDLLDALADRVADRLAQHGSHGPASPYLTTADAAAYMCCARQRIHDITSQGKLPVFRDGSRCLYRIDDLDAYLRGEAS